jgi:prephenate dehydrogenase
VRVAVLGVGLIGGSIGLAAKSRLDAEVRGFDPDPEVIARATDSGALDAFADSAADAVAGADIVFCAAPVGALSALVAEALAATDDAAVTDVGSTKRDLIAGLPAEGAERFIGGHPLAGAETSGVENARAELFEGARWYLTPTERSSGVHYDRLQRLVADLGARPQAIDPEAHDRVMATVSHLPHVLANVLVQEAAFALTEESERLPEVGPSFRDTTRVAGANPGIWPDIFASNREAVAAEIDAVAARLGEAAALLRAGDADAVRDWHRAALEDRRRLLEGELVGGELHQLRVGVENRPGTVAEIALALGRAAVNIEDMALYPAADMRTGAISIWVAGQEEAKRAAEVVRRLGHSTSIADHGDEGK